MLIEEIIQRVQSMYSRGLQSKNTRLTSRHTYSAISTARTILLKQQHNKNQAISQWAYQLLPCVELIKAPIHECACISSNGCVILRSKHKIPKPVSGIDKHLIKSVTSLDGSIRFDESSFENEKYSDGNKYTANKPGYYFRNGYLYITVSKVLKAVPVIGLFDDVIEAYKFPSYCSDECVECECMDITKLEYPIDGDLIKPLIQIAMDELIIIMKQVNEDRSNNATDDTGSTGMIHEPQSSKQ